MGPGLRTVKQRFYPRHDLLEFLFPDGKVFPRDRAIRQRLAIFLNRIHA